MNCGLQLYFILELFFYAVSFMARIRFLLASDIGKKKKNLTQEISDFQPWNIRKITYFQVSCCQKREVVATTVKRLSFKTN